MKIGQTSSARALGPSLCLILLVPVLAAGCFHGSDPEPVETDQVVVPGAWVFEPEVIQVTPGTTVTWTNNGGQAHTVTFEDLDFDEEIGPGEQTTFTLEQTGTYDYICRYHTPDMVGTVIVEESAQDGEEGDSDGNA